MSIIEEKSSGGEDVIMKSHIKKLAALAAVMTLVSLFSQVPFSSQSPSPEELSGSGLGDVQTLLAAYDRWKATVAQNGGDRQLFLGLRYSKGLSAEYTKARGWAMIDLLEEPSLWKCLDYPIRNPTTSGWSIINQGPHTA